MVRITEYLMWQCDKILWLGKGELDEGRPHIVGSVLKTSISEIVKIEIFIPEYDILYYADVLSGFGEKSPCF